MELDCLRKTSSISSIFVKNNSQKLERNRKEQLEKYYPNLICTQSLGHVNTLFMYGFSQFIVAEESELIEGMEFQIHYTQSLVL
ncbi:hypothetical protein L1987_11406 [Smallanthus sonchifolius]|uniref:Uncharacterized protein n=1 Tax=Smallanthus sonchifolius TaxID=185202 RepID=A0ACB9JDI5_9ASTR|nr:hypothetical protein L1987_11406 [Smallanthus sonchifolius]